MILVGATKFLLEKDKECIIWEKIHLWLDYNVINFRAYNFLN